MKIAVLGLGTVGSGVINLLRQNKDIIEERTGESYEITHVFGHNNRYNIDLTDVIHTSEIDDIIQSDVDIVIEVMGGIDFAYETIKSLLQAGKHVVSANKDMIALHVDELSEIANKNQVQFNYEASVGGGIPVILGLQNGLNANRISRILGILNGTTNYILTRMTEDNWDFDYALEQAQALGYAEADPTNDVGGFDAQRKTAILSRLAYRKSINLDDVAVTGIQDLKLEDIQIAQSAGYTIKLIGLSEARNNQIDMMVAPMLLESSSQLAKVNEAMNAVFFNGDAIGETMFYGPGAGSMETASAIVSDVMSIMNFGYIGNTITTDKATISHDDFERPFYVRLNATNEAVQGVLDADAYEVLQETEEGIAIKTVPYGQSKLTELLRDLTIQAIYPIID